MAQTKATQQFQKLNTLESVILSAEDSAEDARWQQASIVVDLLDAGVKQRELAREWHNGRTGKPYTEGHVRFTARVWRAYCSTRPRPLWKDAYYTIQQGADELIPEGDRRQQWSDAHEARVPKTGRTAERFVQNLQDAPPGVVDAIYQGAKEVLEERYVEPQERERRRKEAKAFGNKMGEPIVNAFSKLEVILELENVIENLRDMSSLEAKDYDTILRLLDEIRTEAEVKRAMAGVQ